MRIKNPKLPQAPSGKTFEADLVFQMQQLLGQIISQLNNLTEGHVSAVTNATTSPPAAGTWQQGDVIRNSRPVVLGNASAPYIITGWTCVQAGTPGRWVETRSPIGT